MCIAIYKPAGETISTERLQHCWSQHPHGAGFAMPDGNGGVGIAKAMTWDEFVNAWDRDADPALPMLVHFRWATHGGITLGNCHPHRIADDLVMVHNGVIRPMAHHATRRRSDTVAFVDRVLRQLPAEALTSPGVVTLLDHYIGRSRLALMNGAGVVTLVGETRGEWDRGCWYSNNSYRTIVHRRATRTLPATAPYPHRRRDMEQETLKANAHQLLKTNGPDLTLWSDEDLTVLALAYPADANPDWSENEWEALVS